MGDLKDTLQKTRAEFEDKIKNMTSSADLENLRVEFFGKKGKLTGAMKGMGQLTDEERPAAGKMINEAKAKMETAFEDSSAKIREMEKSLRFKREVIDVTLPSRFRGAGSRHPVNITINDICDIFFGLGFSLAESPGSEYERYDFELLRIIGDQKPPFKYIFPGNVYRPDDIDSTHSPVLHRIEGLVVDKGVTMGDLIGTLDLFAVKFFGEDTKIRLRPRSFPLTGPSAQADITCLFCGGRGCPVCKGEGRVGILGAGMVHPEVLENRGIDSSLYSGFAFGIDVERTVMLRYGIDDIRLLYENDVRFLKQFK